MSVADAEATDEKYDLIVQDAIHASAIRASQDGVHEIFLLVVDALVSAERPRQRELFFRRGSREDACTPGFRELHGGGAHAGGGGMDEDRLPRADRGERPEHVIGSEKDHRDCGRVHEREAAG